MTSRVNNTLVILTADHGESFERGYFLHGEDLSEQSTHVPFLIRYPGQKKGERIGGLTQSTDIAPTILNVVGVPKPDWMEGQALKPGACRRRRRLSQSITNIPTMASFITYRLK